MTSLRLAGSKLILTPTAPDDSIADLGGRRIGKSNSWAFPPLCCYYERIQDRYRNSLTIDPSTGSLDLPWGFPSKLFQWTKTNWGTLFEYQKEAVDFLVSSPRHGSLLALSPGLGKTLVSITAARMMGKKRILVVAPFSLLVNWEGEISKWDPGESVSIAHRTSPGETTWVVTNYDTFARRRAVYLAVKWDLVIFDESILLKHHSTKKYPVRRSEAALELSRLVPKVWLLSGSPTSKFADDLYGQLLVIEPSMFPSYWRFVHHYCNVVDSIWGTQVTGSRAIDFIKEFRDLMFVRHQKDVLILPGMLQEMIDVPMTDFQSRTYTQLRDQFITELQSGDITVTSKLARLVRLQQCVSSTGNLVTDEGTPVQAESGKLNALVELIELGHIPLPAIVWVHWKSTGEEVFNRLHNIEGVHPALASGSVDDSSAQIQSFKEGRSNVLVMSLGVGKYGHTLTMAQSMVYFDRTWDADAYIQSQYRVQRIGLDHEVISFTLRTPRTTDEIVEANLAGKFESISRISNADLITLLRGVNRGT